jgi:phosphorylcholine metabolism protein LicD
MNNINHELFDISKGFGNYKNLAIEILNNIIKILNKFNIDYFLISGSLLGCVRHFDFIPWDDDIDIIVSDDFNLKFNDILLNTNIKYMFFKHNNYIYKFCCRDKILSHSNNEGVYYWPFVDIFIFNKSDNMLNFFNKDWDINFFYPPKKIIFNSICVSIPFNPNYFLTINYGSNYMTEYKSNTWNHKLEKKIKNKNQITIKIK